MANEQMTILLDEPLSMTSQQFPKHLNYGMNERRMYDVTDISGLYYFPDFLDETVQSSVIKHIDASGWRRDLERRVQHYGWRYDYQARTITLDMKLGPLPDWIAEIAARLYNETKLFDRIPDQAIVNEYEPGQGIALHADRSCFGAAVATVSLNDDWEMKLRPVAGTRDEDKSIMLMRGSALIMTGEARSRWMHGIDRRKTEDDGKRRRRRRLSLTFRTVLEPSSRHRSVGGEPEARADVARVSVEP